MPDPKKRIAEMAITAASNFSGYTPQEILGPQRHRHMSWVRLGIYRALRDLGGFKSEEAARCLNRTRATLESMHRRLDAFYADQIQRSVERAIMREVERYNED